MEISNPDSAYWVGLNSIPYLGAVHFKQLLEYFKTAEAVWKASEKELQSLDLGPRLLASLIENRPKINSHHLLDTINTHNIHIITFYDIQYPSLLKEIYDPPMMLFIKGSSDVLTGKLFSVIGTRKVTPYGQRVAAYFVEELVRHGYHTVSGMARGTDSLVHKITIENNGKTIAVLGCGLDIIYPPENRQLSEKIIHQGALISEFPLGMPPLRQNFLIRNRIISGLSGGLLVTEAAKISGSINIAHQALDQNRDVFAIPGSIFNPLSLGTLQLIKDGAKPCQTISDIIEDVKGAGAEQEDAQKAVFNTPEEKLIFDILKETDILNSNEMVVRSKLPISKINSVLTSLELSGRIENFGGSNYGIKK